MILSRLFAFLRTGRTRTALVILRDTLSSPSKTVLLTAVILSLIVTAYTGLIRYPILIDTVTLSDKSAISALTNNQLHAWLWHIHPIAGIAFSFVYGALYIIGVIIFGVIFYYAEHRQLPM